MKYDWSYHGIWPDNGPARILVEEARFGPTERETAAILRELVEPGGGGFGWGYDGSGTSCAAAAILADALDLGDLPDSGIYFGDPDPTLVMLREDFCLDGLAELCDEWRMRRGAVLRWARGWHAEHGLTEMPRAVAQLPPVDPYTIMPSPLERRGMDEPRLTVEIVPTSLHGKSPRQVLGRSWWDKRRRQAYAAAGNRCEICGGVGKRHPVEAHERYEYDETARPPVQRILAIIAICPDCHAVKHLYRTHAVSIECGDSSIFETALAHLGRVNGWDRAQVRTYLDQVRAVYQHREALGTWVQDFSPLGEAPSA